VSIANNHLVQLPDMLPLQEMTILNLSSNSLSSLPTDFGANPYFITPKPYSPYHTVDYGPFIKRQVTLWAVNFKDFLMRIWSRYR
jgi:hypothetical protein